MLSNLSPPLMALVTIALALVAIFWPPPRRRADEARRKARLVELEEGAEEAYFEERRALQTYGPNSAGPFRLFGFLLLILGIAILVL